MPPPKALQGCAPLAPCVAPSDPTRFRHFLAAPAAGSAPMCNHNPVANHPTRHAQNGILLAAERHPPPSRARAAAPGQHHSRRPHPRNTHTMVAPQPGCCCLKDLAPVRCARLTRRATLRIGRQVRGCRQCVARSPWTSHTFQLPKRAADSMFARAAAPGGCFARPPQAVGLAPCAGRCKPCLRGPCNASSAACQQALALATPRGSPVGRQPGYYLQGTHAVGMKWAALLVRRRAGGRLGQPGAVCGMQLAPHTCTQPARTAAGAAARARVL